MQRIDPWRPCWHYTAARNWIKYPNGLIFDGGEYHLFYQYNPNGSQWGYMSWGHAVSSDLLHWQELPLTIAEDERAIFSGSVVIDRQDTAGFGAGAWVAIYTGCLRRPEGGQAQELAFSIDRGRTWTKYEHNPVLDLALREFRDPKVFWHAPAARWTMAVVLPEARAVVFYASHDLKTWTELSRFADDLAGQGIWECPDLFELPIEGEVSSAWVLKVDVFEGHPSQGSGARLFFGHFDGTRFAVPARPVARVSVSIGGVARSSSIVRMHITCTCRWRRLRTGRRAVRHAARGDLCRRGRGPAAAAARAARCLFGRGVRR